MTTQIDLPLAERRILEDLLERGITPAAVTKRRGPEHIASLVIRGLVVLNDAGDPVIADVVSARVALGRRP